jgi:catechol 2,3-dioxygenase-like lactoylglutathione lyase family enzyme
VPRARLYGINHVALEVDDVEEAVAFFGRIFEVRSVSRVSRGAFVDIGDQFIALFERGVEEAHFGLVVDDKDAVRGSLAANGVEPLPGRRLDVRDPSGNRIQVVQYDEVQFTKDAGMLRAMGLSAEKTEAALDELREKGLGPAD